MRLGRRPGLVATRSGVDRADRVGQPGRLVTGLHGTFTRHKGELNRGTPMLIPYTGRVQKGGWAMTHKGLFSVEGLMCGTCLVEVLERLHDLDGVVEVGVSLRVGGHSPVVVRSDELVAPEALVTAVTEAGFAVTDRSLSTRRVGRVDMDQGVQVVRIKVQGGYSLDLVEVTRGAPVRIEFVRQEAGRTRSA